MPDSCWLEAFLDAVKTRPAANVFEGRTYADGPRRSLSDVSPVNLTGGYLWSCNFMIRRILFEKLHGFDERFPDAAMEDVDFRLRLRAVNEQFFFVMDASVCHPWRKAQGWKQLRRHRASTLIYLAIHPDQRAEINSASYFRGTVSRAVRITLPGLFKYHGRGLIWALMEHCMHLWMGIELALLSRHSISRE